MAAGAPIILFEDNHILAVNKRPSDIVQSDKTGDETLADRARDSHRRFVKLADIVYQFL